MNLEIDRVTMWQKFRQKMGILLLLFLIKDHFIKQSEIQFWKTDCF